MNYDVFFSCNSHFNIKAALNLAKKDVLIANFSILEWDDLKKNASSSNNTKFLVRFDNVLSQKLQQLGLKCWLRSKKNRFKKVNILISF